MDRTEMANRILDHLRASGRWNSTTQILYHLNMPKMRMFVLEIMKVIHRNGLVSRFGTGKFRWKLRVDSWDRFNPLHYIPPGWQVQEEEKKQDPSQMESALKNLERRLSVAEDNIARAAESAQKTARVVAIKILGDNIQFRKVKGKPHAKLEHVVKLCAARLNVLLIGPAGSGKTYLSAQVAECLNQSFAFISCSAGMSEGQLLGRLIPCGKGGTFEYVRSEFVKCYEEGGVFLFDEVDAADPNTLLILNTSLANGHLAIPNRPEKPIAIKHKDFIVIAAANTFGTGADRQYVGRNQLDEAFLDRFRIGQVVVEYDESLEAFLCPDEDLRGRLAHYRKNVNKGKVRRIISSRFLKEAYIAKTVAGLSDDEIDTALFGGWSADEVAKAKEGYVKPQPKQEKKTEDKPESIEDMEEKIELQSRILQYIICRQQEGMSSVTHSKICNIFCIDGVPTVVRMLTQMLKDGLIVSVDDSDTLAYSLPKQKKQDDKEPPKCKFHPSVSMIRMSSGKGWRCGIIGNRFDTTEKRWTVCNQCIFDGEGK